MERDTIYKRSENVTFQTVAGEAILIRMETGTYFSLNVVGTDFWERIDGQTPLFEHAENIAEAYNEKTQGFISQLIELAKNVDDTNQRDAALWS